MDHVTRIHLKTGKHENRTDLIRYCLYGDQQYIAIGWSYVYRDREIQSFHEYYYAVKAKVKRIPSVHNIFWETREGDLFWTRDLDGYYWICRATGLAQMEYSEELDIGAVIPVKAYRFGMEVPGQIKASFNRPRGGTSERISEPAIVEYSKRKYNELSGIATYVVEPMKGNLLDNLPPLDLEELVLSYIQLKEDYYLLSGSIANKSTTVKVEGEFIHRNKEKYQKAVVQVKGRGAPKLDALAYQEFVNDGFVVYLFAPEIENNEKMRNCFVITPRQLLEFYEEYRSILPESITVWEDLCKA